MRIILTGGGTMGAVYPLLAIKEAMEAKGVQAKFLFVGTRDGIEKDIIERENILYEGISAGKFRRYFSLENLATPFQVVRGLFQSLSIIKEFNPDLVISVGGFVSVPVIWAASFRSKKIIIHQQDIKTGLSNLLTAKMATKITCAFAKSTKSFPKDKAVLIGNPVRKSILEGEKERGMINLGLDSRIPTLFVLGGSSGSEFLNNLMMESLTRLIDFCQIIHITGKGNSFEWADREKFGDKSERYHQYEYLYDEMADAYAASDLVVSRAGLSTLTELTYLQKASIIIAIPDHQQEENAVYFASKNAIMQLDQNKTSADDFVSLTQDLLENKNSLDRLGQNINAMMKLDANEKFVELIEEMVKHS
jgi:UDP-N-acetylglucosamine--N-acetylmuramyl-(pentapeptide) pyrophosphoryl-undecaprenol N-acetylglucosamine transferase